MKYCENLDDLRGRRVVCTLCEGARGDVGLLGNLFYVTASWSGGEREPFLTFRCVNSSNILTMSLPTATGNLLYHYHTESLTMRFTKLCDMTDEDNFEIKLKGGRTS